MLPSPLVVDLYAGESAADSAGPPRRREPPLPPRPLPPEEPPGAPPLTAELALPSCRTARTATGIVRGLTRSMRKALVPARSAAMLPSIPSRMGFRRIGSGLSLRRPSSAPGFWASLRGTMRGLLGRERLSARDGLAPRGALRAALCRRHRATSSGSGRPTADRPRGISCRGSRRAAGRDLGEELVELRGSVPHGVGKAQSGLLEKRPRLPTRETEGSKVGVPVLLRGSRGRAYPPMGSFCVSISSVGLMAHKRAYRMGRPEPRSAAVPFLVAEDAGEPGLLDGVGLGEAGFS
jgi:hypothetical protein